MNLALLDLSQLFDPNFFLEHKTLLIPLLIWVFVWKGFALWKSSRRIEKWWFIALLVINTFGILEILYLFVFSKKAKGQFPPSPTA